MTRKRYVKLLMALGLPRNAANKDAKGCQRQGLAYRTELVKMRRFFLWCLVNGYRVPRNFMEVLPYE